LAKITDWCVCKEKSIQTHRLFCFQVIEEQIEKGVASLAATLPGHYAASARIARILEKLGKKEAAEYLLTKLPTGTKSRSGDVGEILASHWVGEFTDYKLGILKLRWKDHRDVAMRGDDILAVKTDSSVAVRFLKGEVKSRIKLQKHTVEEARSALLSNDGLPTPHALAFVSDRLSEIGQVALSDTIDEYQLKVRIKPDQVSHLLFAFTGNDVAKLLDDDLNAYSGTIAQTAVAVRVNTHQDFIKAIYDKVAADVGGP
jgi:hypothetical protein